MKSFLVLLLLLNVECNAQEARTQQEVYFKVGIDVNFPESSNSETTIKGSNGKYWDEGILKLPKSYSEFGTPTRLIYCAHGAGGGVENGNWFIDRFQLIDALLENGYACYDVNGGQNVENMGGNWVVQSAVEAYKHIQDNFNVYDEIFVIGLSMGGLSSANFVVRNSELVLAHGMFSPVLGLKEQAWDNPWYHDTPKRIAEAYNFDDRTGSTWEIDKVTNWDPVYSNNIVVDSDTLKKYPVPVKIWHGARDPVVKIGASRKFHRYISNAKGNSELIEIDSDDHGLSVGNPKLNRELILFLKKLDK